MTVKRKSGNTLYLPFDFRKEIEKISMEVSFRRGERISASGIVQYLIKNYSDQAKKELLKGEKTEGRE